MEIYITTTGKLDLSTLSLLQLLEGVGAAYKSLVPGLPEKYHAAIEAKCLEAIRAENG